MKIKLYFIATLSLMIFSFNSFSIESIALPCSSHGPMPNKVTIDSNGYVHSTYFGVPYICFDCIIDDNDIGRGIWYRNNGGCDVPFPNSKSPSFPNSKSPVFNCSMMKPYREVGNSNVGKSSINYEGCVYSVDYDEKENVTTYTPLTFDPAQNVPFHPVYAPHQKLADYYSTLNKGIERMSKFLNIHPEFREKYYNDYLSVTQLQQVYRKLASAAYSDSKAIKNLGYYPYPVKFPSVNSYGFFVYTGGGVRYYDNPSDVHYFFNNPDSFDFILYNNRYYSDPYKAYPNFPSNKLKYISGDTFKPLKFSFNTAAYEYFTSFNTLSRGFSLRTLFYSTRGVDLFDISSPFMDFSTPINSGIHGDDIDSSDDAKPVNPSNPNVPNDSGNASSNIGDVGIGGFSGITDLGGSSSVTGSSGGSSSSVTGSSGGSGSGKAPSGTGAGTGIGAGTNTGETPSSAGTGTGGGHGTAGEGQGGGDTDGDGDALLREVQDFHRDFNDSLNRDANGADDNFDPDYNAMETDFKSRVGDEMGDLEDSVSKLWDEAMVSMSNMLSHIDNLIPDIKTSFDLPPQFVTASQGRCIPLVLDFDIQLVGIPNYHFHGEGVQACLLYDSYIRPVLNFIMVILTFFAVRRLLMHAAEFLTQGK